MTHATLTRPPADLIGGQWIPLTGEGIRSENPAHPDRTIWQGSPVRSHVDQAVEAARRALPAWSAWPVERRVAVLRRFQELAAGRVEAFTDLLTDETGKALWESKGEAGLIGAKVDITLDPQAEHNFGLRRVSGYELSLGETKRAATWFRPHGVMAVVGPFNFPLHLPNGHIIPALLMGNTVVFKPSDKTPACGQALAELLDEALKAEGAPDGVVNMVQGDVENSAALVAHPGLDGILFTGSWPVGRRILEANLDHPGRIVALEMGGNNAAIVLPDADLRQAAIECVRCAFNTTGQRCTCTRRLVVHESIADRFIAAVCKAASQLIVADPRSEHPVFMGPSVTKASQSAVFDFQSRLTSAGGEVLVQSSIPEKLGPGHYVTPSVVRVDRFTDTPGSEGSFDAGCDEEVFGPLLRISVTGDLDDAIVQANATRYGLAASIFTRDTAAIDRFRREARAGCVNVNCGTAGASSKLPFGGLGLSGNHRPAGAYSLDYCAIPIAGMTESSGAAAISPGMTFDDSWL